MAHIEWRSDASGSREQCDLLEIPDGHRLEGVVRIDVGGRRTQVAYQVDVDDAWRTRTVNITVDDEQRRTLTLSSDGEGHWQVDGIPEPMLDGCLDIDLEWTPATNTLPIRRLGLDVGATAELVAAWVRFPALRVERLAQSYARLADRRWRYASESFEAVLDVDADGLVLRYGDIWRAVARSSDARAGL